LEVEHETLGILEAQQRVLDRGLRLERDARVIERRPDARGSNLRGGVGGAGVEQQRIGESEEENDEDEPIAATRRFRRACLHSVFILSTPTPPPPVPDLSPTVRPDPTPFTSSCKPGGEIIPAAFSGHSTRQTASGLKYSLKPASPAS